MKPSILFVVPAQYQALKVKGVDDMIFDRDEGGFFRKVITVHPFCEKTQTIVLNDCHEVHEIGFDLIPGAEKWSILKYLQLPVHFIRIIARVSRLALDNKVSLIRSNDPYWMGLFGFLGARIVNIPFCVSIHADHDKRMELDRNISLSRVFGSYDLAKRLEKFILGRANLVLPIRRTLGQKAVENGANRDKLRIIPHGIELSSFNRPQKNQIRESLGIPSELKILSFVGRLVHENYLNDVLSIAWDLGQRRNDFIVVIAGGGKEEAWLKSQVAADPVLSQRVMMVGFKPREVCLDLRRSSAVSLCLMAGFSLIEACAAGKPVLSYDVEWHSELVESGVTGFLLRENDVAGAVRSIDWLLDHPTESEAMGQRARALAFDRHDLKKTSVIKTACYSELLPQRAPHA